MLETRKEILYSILFLAGLSAAMNVPGIYWGLPHSLSAGLATSDVDWSPDSLAPMGPLSFAKRMLYQEPWLNKYPPFHYIVLCIFYAPYVSYLFLTGQLSPAEDSYPYGLDDPNSVLSNLTLIARIVSSLMGLGLVTINYLAVRRLYGNRAAIIAGFLIVTAYPIIHYSRHANLDIPQLFWFSCILYTVVSILKENKRKYYILLGVFTAFAFSTKESIYAAVIGLIPAIIWVQYVNLTERNEDLKNSLYNLLSGFLAFSAILLLIFNPIMSWDWLIFHFDYHLKRSVGGSWVIRDSSNSIYGNFQLIVHYIEYIRQSNGILVFTAVTASLIYMIVKYPQHSWMFVVPIFAYYVLFLRMHGTHHLRYILPVHLLLIWFTGKTLSDLFNTKIVRPITLKPMIIVILASSLAYGSSINIRYAKDSRYATEDWMVEKLPEQAAILAVGPAYSLPRFESHKNVRRLDLWDYNGRRIADLGEMKPDYIVINMTRQPMRDQVEAVEQFFRESGYARIASFRSEVPSFIPEIPDLHTINPLIVVFGRIQS